MPNDGIFIHDGRLEALPTLEPYTRVFLAFAF